MTLHKLEQMYANFWDEYLRVLPNQISHIPINETPFKIRINNNNEYLIKLRVDFDKCRYKSSSNRKKIAIRIEGEKKCIFEKKDISKITYSNVLINYFKIDELKKQLLLLESLHYDYEINQKSLSNHPIFHCQSSKKIINDPFIGRDDYTIENVRDNVYQHIRIPTANMDMISVLLSIGADHFSVDEFDELIKVYDKGPWHSKLPHTSHNEKFSPKNCYRSRSWYVG